jgi:putative transcriptional regulator
MNVNQERNNMQQANRNRPAMVKYHPEVRYLTDYSAGSLPTSQALCVATHLHYCSNCRARVRDLNELGTALFTRQQPMPVKTESFGNLMARIREPGKALSANFDSTAKQNKLPKSGLPRAIERLCKGNLENLGWRSIGKQFRFAPLQLGDKFRETTLFHIRAGGAVPKHQHRGDEITVVLQGSFSDHEDKYGVGDFIVRTPGEVHRPVASQDEDCLCLSTLDAPIRMSNWLLRLLMPFFNPSLGRQH